MTGTNTCYGTGALRAGQDDWNQHVQKQLDKR